MRVADLVPGCLLQQNPRTAFRRMDGRGVLIVIDRQRLHALNDVGARVWELAEDRSVEMIVQEIIQEFEVDRDRAQVDVRAFVEEMLELGALQTSPARVP